MSLKKEFHNVLVVAPHTDDGELGAGAFISKLLNAGSNVTYAAFSTADEALPASFPIGTLKNELLRALEVLGGSNIKTYIYDYSVRKLNYYRQEILDDFIELRKNKYDLVLIPSLNDIHQDHKTVAEEALRAFKNTTIFGYELMWNNLSFNTTCFVEVSKSDLDKKIAALKMYESQSNRVYMKKSFIESLAITRGVQIGCEYAECFEIIRLKI